MARAPCARKRVPYPAPGRSAPKLPAEALQDSAPTASRARATLTSQGVIQARAAACRASRLGSAALQGRPGKIRREARWRAWLDCCAGPAAAAAEVTLQSCLQPTAPCELRAAVACGKARTWRAPRSRAPPAARAWSSSPAAASAPPAAARPTAPPPPPPPAAGREGAGAGRFARAAATIASFLRRCHARRAGVGFGATPRDPQLVHDA